MSADISIIIPTRDRLWSLPKAIESCRSSTLNIEIIVIDDASTDGTWDWLVRQPDVVAMRGDGWGKPWAVNAALAIATGKYLRFLDSDDWLNPQANEIQHDIAIRSGADVVVAGYDIYIDDTFLEFTPWPQTDDFIAHELGESALIHYSSFLLRREFVAGIPHRMTYPGSNFASRDDICYMLEVALRHPQLAVSDSPSLCHRHHQRGRLSYQRGLVQAAISLQTVTIFRQILKLLERQQELTPRRRKAAAQMLWRMAHQLSVSFLREGAEVAALARELDPTFRSSEPGVLGWMFRSLGFATTQRIVRGYRTIRRSVMLSAD